MAGDTEFWSLFAPNAMTPFSSHASNTPFAAAFAWWMMQSAPSSINWSVARFAAAESLPLPVKTSRTLISGLTDLAPAAKALKVERIEGTSSPPTIPTAPDFESFAAAIPARKKPSSNAKRKAPTLSAVCPPELLTNTVSGKSLATRIEGSLYSYPCPKTMRKPFCA